jgi:UDP-glucose 4-epimerase
MLAIIAITGASGFIGRAFVAHVASCGHRAVPLFRQDLESELQSKLESVDVIVHLAGRAHVLHESAADPAQAFHAANVQLTEIVLQAAIAAKVGRFVLMSSAGVLGNVTSEAGVDDDASSVPYDHYSRSKLVAEHAVRAIAAKRIETVILRPPMVYGPGARGNFARIMRAVSRGWPLPVGALHAPRSMIGLRNLCDISLRASLDARAANATFLVGDEQVVSVRELAVALGCALGKRPTMLSVPVPLLSMALKLIGKNSDVPRLTAPFVIHANRVSEVLGWKPPFTLDQEIAWTIAEERCGTGS